MKKKLIKESVGRDLVGASKFASKSSVVHQILLKYPTPDKLAVSLKEMAANSQDAKVKAKCEELATKCASVDVQQYPKFVGKIAGLSRFWTIAGATVGAAGLTAATTYLVRTMSQAAQDDSFKNAKGFKDSTKALMSKTGNLMGQDYNNIKKSFNDKKDESIQSIRDWAGKQLEKSQSGQDIKHELNRSRSDIDQNTADIVDNKMAQDAGFKNAAEERAALKDAQDAGFKNAAEARAALKASQDAGFANAAQARAALKATQDTDRADSIRRWGEEKNARMKADYGLQRSLNGKVSIGAPSKFETSLKDAKDTAVNFGKNIADPDTWKKAYGPYLEKTKNGATTIKDWLDKLPQVNYGGYSGT